MSTQSDNGGEGTTREFVEREYAIMAYPGDDDFIEDLQNILSGDAPRAHPDIESESVGAQREFARPFAEALTDRDVDETKTRTYTDYVVQVGGEPVELGHDTWEDMMKAAANSDQVTGLQFDEVDDEQTNLKRSPKRLMRRALRALSAELPDEFDISDEYDTFYREDDSRWETGDGEEYVDLHLGSYSAKVKTGTSPDESVQANTDVPYVKFDVDIVAEAEAAVDLLDSQVCDAMMDKLRSLSIESDEGYTADFYVTTGEVETEVCTRTEN